MEVPAFVNWFLTILPSGVSGKFIDSRIMLTAKRLVLFSRSFANFFRSNIFLQLFEKYYLLGNFNRFIIIAMALSYSSIFLFSLKF